MIRTIIIKTDKGHVALAARVNGLATPAEIKAAVEAAVREFHEKRPDEYAAALVGGRFPWTRLFTHMSQGLLEKHGVELMEYGVGWLEIEEDAVEE